MPDYVVHAHFPSKGAGTFVQVRAGDKEYARELVKARMGWYRGRTVVLDSTAITPSFGLSATKIVEANFNGGYSGWSLADYQRSGELAVVLRGRSLTGTVHRGGRVKANEHAEVSDTLAMLDKIHAWAAKHLPASGYVTGLVKPAARIYFGPSGAPSRLHKYGLPGRQILTNNGGFGPIWQAWAQRRVGSERVAALARYRK